MAGKDPTSAPASFDDPNHHLYLHHSDHPGSEREACIQLYNNINNIGEAMKLLAFIQSAWFLALPFPLSRTTFKCKIQD